MIEIIQDDIQLPDVVGAINTMYEGRARVYPVRSIHASSIGHPCERYLFYEQTRWEEKRQPDIRLQMIFELGRLHNKAAIRDLQDALSPVGIAVEQQEVPIPNNPLNIGGRIDCLLRILTDPKPRGVLVPVEIKSMSEFSFQKISTVADMLASPYPYVQGYPAQLTVYMFFTNTEWGLFILRNKSTGEYRQIPMHLDLDYAEGLLKKAERINAAIQAKQEPDRCPWTGKTCGQCPYLSLCMPDMAQVPGIESLLGDAELTESLAIRAVSQAASKRFAEADKSIKDHIKAKCTDLRPGQQRTFLAESWTIEAKKTDTQFKVSIEPADAREN